MSLLDYYILANGINYTFSITIRKDAEITFDSVWISGGTGISLETRKYIVDFKKDEVCTLYASQYYPGERDLYYKDTEVKQESHPPIFYEGNALMKFKVNGKSYYYAVEEMKRLPTLAYP